MYFSELIFFLLHCFISFENWHSWEFINFIGPEVIRKISYLSQKILINLVSLYLLSYALKLVFFIFGFFLLIENLFFSVLISFLELCKLFEIILFFSIISKNLLFLVLKLLSSLELFFHEFLGLKWEFSKCILHVSFLVLILSFDLSLLLLDFKELCVLGFSLKTNLIWYI